MTLPRRRFLHLAAGAAALPFAPTAATPTAIRTAPCASSCRFRPAARAIRSPACSARACPISGASRCWSRTKAAPAAISAQSRPCNRRPTATPIFIATNFLATNPFIYPSLGYDPLTDLAPVTRLTVFANVLLVPPNSPVTSVKDFIAYAKSRAGKAAMPRPASAPSSTCAANCSSESRHRHRPCRLSRRRPGAHRPHGRPRRHHGGDAAVGDVADQGRHRARAGGDLRRAYPLRRADPDRRRIRLPGFDVSDGQCLYMPGKTPPEFVRKVHDDVIAALATPAVNEIRRYQRADRDFDAGSGHNMISRPRWRSGARSSRRNIKAN